MPRGLGAGRGHVPPLHLHAGRGEHAGAALGGARRAAGEDPRDRRRGRRRLRRALQPLSRVLRRALRRKSARAAGEVDREPLGSVPRRRAGARRRIPRRARARRLGPHRRHALRHAREPRRVPRADRAFRQHHRHHQLHLRRVRRAGDVRAHPPRAHQHRADGRVPRRRPPGHVLCDRAARRAGGGGARGRPGGVPAQELHPEERFPLQDRGGLRVRLRRLRGGLGKSAGRRGLEGFCPTEEGIGAPRALERARNLDLYRSHRRRLRAAGPGRARWMGQGSDAG